MDGFARKKKFAHRRARFYKFSRWLHLHFSMFSFLLLLLFSITGFTLHHIEWFDEVVTIDESVEGAVPPDLLVADEPDSAPVVAALAESCPVDAPLSAFESDPDMIFAVFSKPGYRAEIQIDRESGDAEIAIEKGGVLSVLQDIHTGKNENRAAQGGLLIDVAALLLIFVSLTGIALTWILNMRNKAAWLTFGAGTATAVVWIAAMAIF
jgi:hypothetical protein